MKHLLSCWQHSCKPLVYYSLFIAIFTLTKTHGFLRSTFPAGFKTNNVVTSPTSIFSSQELEDSEKVQNESRKNTKDVLNLDSIRGSLIRQEETIIFAMIERAQFSLNPDMYNLKDYDLVPEDPAMEHKQRKGSFLEFMLCETEKLHSRVRRYKSPEEYPFFPSFISEPILPSLDFPSLLYDHSVNMNQAILNSYTDLVLPRICPPGDDEQHGSSALADIAALQALSKRVHYGLFVAESKYQEKTEEYTRLCKENNPKGVYDLLTNKVVEEHVLKRAHLKASTYGQDISGNTNEYKVRPSVIAGLYQHVIIPLTKEVEVLYLFERTGCPPPDLRNIHEE